MAGSANPTDFEMERGKMRLSGKGTDGSEAFREWRRGIVIVWIFRFFCGWPSKQNQLVPRLVW